MISFSHFPCFPLPFFFDTGGLSNGAESRRAGLYDPVSRKWERIENMPHGVHHAAYGVVDNRFIVMGGRQGGNGLTYGKPYSQGYDPGV
jgi:hypothetical protein